MIELESTSVPSHSFLDITPVALVGAKECKIETLCDYVIKVPSTSTTTIQESHLTIEHSICAIIEDEIFGNKDRL